jgi:hypothetical protein
MLQQNINRLVSLETLHAGKVVRPSNSMKEDSYTYSVVPVNVIESAVVCDMRLIDKAFAAAFCSGLVSLGSLFGNLRPDTSIKL